MSFVRRLEYTVRPTGFGDMLDEKTIRVGFAPAGSGSHLTVNVLPFDATERFSFKNLGEFWSAVHSDAPQPLAFTNLTMALIEITRHSNYIAGRTRRGSGNTFLHGRDTVIPEGFRDLLRSRGTTVCAAPGLSPAHGFLCYRGDSFNGIHDGMAYVPRDRHGMLDGPYSAVISSDGAVEAIILKNRQDAMGNARDYCQMFEAT